MAIQSVTINLPEMLYRRVERRAKRVAASLEDELVAVVASGLSRSEDLPVQTLDALAQLDLMSDDELRRAAQLVVDPADNERMQLLLDKQESIGLGQGERQTAQQLLQHSDHVMLLRAKAAALLHKRGHDVTSLFLMPPNNEP